MSKADQGTIRLLIVVAHRRVREIDALLQRSGEGTFELGLTEEMKRELGIERAQRRVELACLCASRDSRAGSSAQVRYFPSRNTLTLIVGDDVQMDVTGTPEELGVQLATRAHLYLQRLGYALRQPIGVREVVRQRRAYALA